VRPAPEIEICAKSQDRSVAAVSCRCSCWAEFGALQAGAPASSASLRAIVFDCFAPFGANIGSLSPSLAPECAFVEAIIEPSDHCPHLHALSGRRQVVSPVPARMQVSSLIEEPCTFSSSLSRPYPVNCVWWQGPSVVAGSGGLGLRSLRLRCRGVAAGRADQEEFVDIPSAPPTRWRKPPRASRSPRPRIGDGENWSQIGSNKPGAQSKQQISVRCERWPIPLAGGMGREALSGKPSAGSEGSG
jgi:hypothetical protein